MSTDPEFDELKREFLTEAEIKIGEISTLLSEKKPTPTQSLDRMIYLVHQLKGSGGSYGFASISSDAAALESALEKIREKTSEELQKEVERRLESLHQVVQNRLREMAS